ncbi:MAG: ArsR/SmtB family transcription factor [Candidatus Dormibacteria bacterium]
MTATPEVDVGQVFIALADPTRRQLLETLGRGRCASASSLAAELPVSRQAVMKHLALLERSKLVSSNRSGREVLFTVRPETLAIAGSWMTELALTWRVGLQVLKQVAESAPVSKLER